jgi:hypothetical protein
MTQLIAGIARTSLTPFWGVELTGWGYYIQRRWQTIRDPLHATAVAVSDGQCSVMIITLDLMLIDTTFTNRTRKIIATATGMDAASILITCSHSHNAPAAGGLLGVGQCDSVYEDWASRQAATAGILAWQSRQPVRLCSGTTVIDELSYNRTRSGGKIDPTLTVARLERSDGSPLAVLVNFAAHPTVLTELCPFAVSRDVPGQVCDRIQQALTGATVMYLQGACGDVNFHPEYSTQESWHLPGQRLAVAALESLRGRHLESKNQTVSFSQRQVLLPTRRWTETEIMQDRLEAQRRLACSDFGGWREGFGRVMTNRPDDMIRRHGGSEEKAVRAMCRFHIEWTDLMLKDYQQRPEHLETEVQAIRIGGLYLVANSSEFFAPLALDLRQRSTIESLMIACYANGRIGYLPDEHDIIARSYAGFQSPKYCNQFPFTPESGPAMVKAMLQSISDC